MRTEAETEYFDIRSVRSAYDDFRRNPDYDAERYAEKLRELESLCASDADADKERIIELKREILLSNPLLDDAKIIVGRYRLGDDRARRVWARAPLAPILQTNKCRRDGGSHRSHCRKLLNLLAMALLPF